MSTIAVTTITPDDLRAAPAWVHHLLEQWSMGVSSWTIDVYTEIKDGVPVQNLEMVGPNDEPLATGPYAALARYFGKANLATVARGTLLKLDGPLPYFLHPQGHSGDFRALLAHPEEAAWLLGVTRDTLRDLASWTGPDHLPLSEEFLERVEELNPGIRDTWASHLQQAITAVHLL